MLLGPVLLQHPQRTAWTPQVLPLYEPSWLSSSCWAWLCVKEWFRSYRSVQGWGGGAGAASEGQQPSQVAAVPRHSGVSQEGLQLGPPKHLPCSMWEKKSPMGFLLAIQEQVLDPRPQEYRQVTPQEDGQVTPMSIHMMDGPPFATCQARWERHVAALCD